MCWYRICWRLTKRSRLTSEPVFAGSLSRSAIRLQEISLASQPCHSRSFSLRGQVYTGSRLYMNARIESLPVSPSVLQFSLGAFLAWLTILTPLTCLVAWVNEAEATPWLLLNIFLVPFVYLLALRCFCDEAKRLHRWVMQAFGLGAIFCMAVVVAAVIHPHTSPWFAAGVALALGSLGSWYGMRSALQVRDRYLRFEDERIDEPVRLVQISDVHIGSRSSQHLQRIVDQAKAHDPAAIVITGDLIDRESVTPEDLSALRQFACPVFFSTGNHEYDVGIVASLERIQAQGVRLVRDECIDFRGIRLIGIDDREDGQSVGPALWRVAGDASRFRVMLYHRPDGWAAARNSGVDLMLAGHTHGGQIWPFNHFVRCRYPQLLGLYRQGAHTLYVSPGAGAWGPAMRFGTRSEMTIIDLHPA